MSATFLTIFEKDGKHWVDTGHADVGPFDTRDEAKAHIWQIIEARVTHELGPKDIRSEADKFCDEINSDYYVEFLNSHMPDTLFTLEQRAHHHVFSEIKNYPEEDVRGFVCTCGVQTFYVEED